MITIAILIVLIILYIYFIVRAMKQDANAIEKINDKLIEYNSKREYLLNNPNIPEKEHKIVIGEILKLEDDMKNTEHSSVKKILLSSRDGAIRGALVGAITSGSIAAYDGTILWLLLGGIMNGISDTISWDTRILNLES